MDRLDEYLREFEAAVRRYAARLDLVAPDDLGRFRARHVDDSLRALPLVGGLPAGPLVDVGSGAGLPGIPLALATPERRWRLLEPRTKRAGFLEQIVRDLRLSNCEVIVKTAEEAAADPGLARAHAGGFARALAPPARALELVAPLVAPGGSAIVFVGRAATLPANAEEVLPGLARVRLEADASEEHGSGA